MSWLSFRSTVAAEEMSFGEVEGDEIVFRGDARERSWSRTRRRNLPPAVDPHSTYSDIRVDLIVEGALPDSGDVSPSPRPSPSRPASGPA
jgi:hypothetical protein